LTETDSTTNKGKVDISFAMIKTCIRGFILGSHKTPLPFKDWRNWR